MNLAEAKSAYTTAEGAVRTAQESLRVSALALYRALLAEKGLVEEQTCRLIDPKGKELVGVFRIIEQSSGLAFRFFAYKKDATLSGNPSAFNFGIAPEVSWESAGVSGVKACAPPEPPVEDV